MKKNTVIKISMDENDEIELVMEGDPVNLATALVCGLTRAAAEIYDKLPGTAKVVFVNEITDFAYRLSPESEAADDE